MNNFINCFTGNKRYEEYLKDTSFKINYDYPMTVVLELVNRCNLE